VPNYKYIEAGSAPEVPVPASAEELLEAIAAAEAKVQSFRVLRYNIRQTEPKATKLAKLDESTEDFTAALKDLSLLQKKYARLVKETPDGPAQVIKVGTASESDEAKEL
jgi:hypothetical protein